MKLDPASKSLDATMKLIYINRSPDTLKYIWFHVWPNAYRNDKTLYSEQLLENGDTRFYFSGKEKKGYLNRLEFRVNGDLASQKDHPEYIDIIKLILPNPLPPGDSISISSSFHERLPYNFNGNGYSKKHFEVRNWYPEPAVYDNKGWHEMPFLIQGGAYHELADYYVQIEVPQGLTVAAGARPDSSDNHSLNHILSYHLHQANSFAWSADSQYILHSFDTVLLSGKNIHYQYFYHPGTVYNDRLLFEKATHYMNLLSAWLIPYPHQTLTLVQEAPMEDQSFSGIIYLGSTHLKKTTDAVLRNELSGQWFQTMILSDQRNYPWLSKGFMNYYSLRMLNDTADTTNQSHGLKDNLLWLRVAEKEKTAQPVTSTAPEFTTINDSLMPAVKGGLFLKKLDDTLGRKNFDDNMLNYFTRWQFNHPYPVYFDSAIVQHSPLTTEMISGQLESTGSLFTANGKRVLKPVFIFSARNTEKYNYIGLSPVAGYNNYDDVMAGMLIHNINLPANKIEFVLTPLYAFGSHRLEGFGRISYSWLPDQSVKKITVGINGGRFASNKATDSTLAPLYESWSKLVPYIRIDFKRKNPRSSISKWIDFKTYLISENSFGSYSVSGKDSLIHPNSVYSNFRYVNQISLNLEDTRALYPYDLRIELQQSELFYRINAKVNYFFNYPEGGGMQIRFFASKFGVWNNENLNSVTRYEPKLLGVNGQEDYLYEDYFIGRTASFAFENTSVANAGIAAQQIMNRDGGLKLRIDQYDFLQGKSANWVTAINFTTSLPSKLLPMSIPIRLFFDVGTYAEAWQEGAQTAHFLYTGGVQISLFRNVLNIYAPIFYSSDFDQALSPVSFGRKVTFSIDFQRLNYKTILKKRLSSHD